MDDNKDSNNLSDEDRTLWEAVNKDTAPLKKDGAETPSPSNPNKNIGSTRTPPPQQRNASSYNSKNTSPANMRPNKDLDRRTDTRLRQGKISINAIVDLHGLTRAQAEDKLRSFVQKAYTRNHRCILVITGKGTLSAPSVLRKNVPLWLSEPPLCGIVLKSYPAQPKDGGSGALYVYLRRNRDV